MLLAAVCLLAGVHAALHARRALIEPLPTVPLPLPDHGPRFVVVADAFEFVQTVHEAPETSDRLVYLIDGLSHLDSPRSSPEISVLGLSALLPLHVEDYEVFVATNDRFWVFDETGRWAARLRAKDTNSGHDLAAVPGRLQLWTR